MEVTNQKPIERVAPVQSSPEKSAQTSRLPKQPDRVSLSTRAKQMQQADAERIQSLAQAIADGTYEVDLQNLAEAIVRRNFR